MCHRRRTSSLLALECLDPPSPFLTPGGFSSASSGEIPIFLDFLSTVRSLETGTYAQVPDPGCLKPDLTALAKFSPMAAFFPMSDSSDIFAVSGTNAADEIPQSSATQNFANDDSLENAESPLVEVTFEPSSPISRSLNSNGYLSLNNDASRFTISAYLASPSVYGDAPEGFSTEEDCRTAKPTVQTFSRPCTLISHGTLPEGLSEFAQENQPSTTNEEMSIPTSKSLSTIEFALITPTVSCSENSGLSPPLTPCSADRTPTQDMFIKRGRRTELLQPAATLKAKMKTERDHSIKSSSSASDIRTHLRPQKINAKPRPATTYIPNDDHDECTVFKQVENQSPVISYPFPSLRHAQWLRDTIVELWIDQEGFRAIRPKFYLASVGQGLPLDQSQFSSHAGDPLYTTVAEFLPVNRESHFFHHATLDRAPTLNRITVNGDESRDFTTRQATLTLKDNGVFYVHGTEDHRIEGTARIVRLNWRFEYLVASRKPGPRGKVHRGEKIFKTLSFSCTPALLHRSRASKVSVLHIMKKTVCPKILAQKLDLPDLPVPVPSALANIPTEHGVLDLDEGRVRQAADQVIAASPSGASLLKKRRKRSVTAGDTPVDSTPASPVIHTMSPIQSMLKYTKHRRGSRSDVSENLPRIITHERSRSANFDNRGKQSILHSPVSEHFASSATPSATATAKTVSPATATSIAGHIIPRSELMKLFESDKDNKTRRPHSLRVEIVNNTQITILPPPHRPRPTAI